MLFDEEKACAQEWQRKGKWIGLWRIAGMHGNYSLFDVDSHEELNEILWSLPLFDRIDFEVVALCRHRSALNGDILSGVVREGAQV